MKLRRPKRHTVPLYLIRPYRFAALELLVHAARQRVHDMHIGLDLTVGVRRGEVTRVLVAGDALKAGCSDQVGVVDIVSILPELLSRRLPGLKHVTSIYTTSTYKGRCAFKLDQC